MLKFKTFCAKDKFKEYKKDYKKLCPLDLSKISAPCTKGLVSVVLPVKDGERFIKEAINSVLNQTYKNFELIIVDDGSTDNTPKIISEMTDDSRVKVITMENKGLPTALNVGFNAAKGEFLTWISADNVADRDFLSVLICEMIACPSVAMVYGNMRLIDECGRLIRCHGWYELPIGSANVKLPKNTNALNIVANNTIGAAFLYRASAAEIIGGYSPYRFGTEDYDYWMRFNEVFEIKHIKESRAIYSYRMHKDSLTARDSELGITKNRYKLMAFDDFRRDFLLSDVPVYIDSVNEKLLKIFKRSGLIPVEKNLSAAEIPIDDKTLMSSEMKQVCLAVGARTRAQIIKDTEERWAKPTPPAKKLTVAICTDGRADTLFEAAEAVAKQMDNDTELLLVDNNPKNRSSKDVFDEIKEKFKDSNIRYIISPILGLSYARNTAIWEAEGEIILYLDDDSVAEENLLSEMIKAFTEHKEAGIIGGEIKLVVPPKYEKLVAKYGGGLWSEFLVSGSEYITASKADYPYGACFGARREILYLIGGFPTAFGRRGEDFGGGEELYAANMAKKVGYTVGICPKAKVLHKVAAERFTKEHAKRTRKSAKRTLKRLNFFFT